MIVNEIFSSISGEGKNQGKLTTFIRLAGCNLYCSYCDTVYARDFKSGGQMNIEQIVKKCQELKNYNIIVTGGEPLARDDIYDLLEVLCDGGWKVEVETNGTFAPTFRHENISYTMDYKCPSSGEHDKMYYSNFDYLQDTDTIKFVVKDRNDLHHVQEIYYRKRPDAQIIISPIYGKIELHEIVDFMKQYNLQGVKMQVQLHKIIWDKDTRGV